MPAVPSAAPAPSPRSARQWLIAAAQSLGCAAVGMLIFLVAFGFTLEEFADDPPAPLLALAGVDALIGIPAGLAIGPLRFLPPGRLRTIAHLVLAGAAGISTWAAPASTLALLRLGRNRRLRIDILALVLVLATSLVTLLIDASVRTEAMTSFVVAAAAVMVVGAAIPLLIGRVLATRWELLQSLRAQAAAAEGEREAAEQARASADDARVAAEREAAALSREHDADAARIRAEERAALSRDMHDSVSHQLATIAMHAGAMTFREDLPVPELRRTAGTVRDAAQQANRELREVLVALRTGDTDAPLATVPTLTEIVDRARERGEDVSLTWEGLTPSDLDARGRGTVVALARILAETVTNAAKHAPGAAVTVVLRREDERLLLTVRNPLDGERETSVSTGHGLVGVQERSRLLGGDARHGPAGGCFEVEAWVPW